MISVDVLTVLAPGQEICEPVLAALTTQGRVTLRHFVVEGPRLPDESRVAAIARARNRAKQYGTAPYALFLDSDVVLPPLGIEKLVRGLISGRHYAALGINYQAPFRYGWPLHVAMGATLFARPVLHRVRFRAGGNHCECYWCCMDVRRMGYAIGYLPGLRAEHLVRDNEGARK